MAESNQPGATGTESSRSLAASPPPSATNVTPGTTIDEPGYYVLNRSFTNSSEGIEITSSDVILDGQGHTLGGTDATTDHGVRVTGNASAGIRISNVTVKNITLDDWKTGISVTSVDDGRTHNIVASNNSNTGILYHYATNGTISNSSVRKTGIGTGADGWGIDLISSDDNTIRGNNVSDPGKYVTGVEIDGQNNTVTRNYVSGPQWAPVILTDNTGNLVYDNYLNGVPPHEFDGWEWNANTTWNVSKRPGPNIMGGPYIGGNYWAKPDGTGFSQTHVDGDGDGFVDQRYKSDHLPLTKTPGVEPGQTINQPGRYVLTRSFINSSAGIDIASSDVILDGKGHTLDGSASSSGDGVFVFNETLWDAGDRLSNVTVKNLTLTDWSDGLQFAGVNDARTENVVAARNSKNGLYYLSANNGSIEDSKATSNDDAGVKLENADNHSLRDNDLRNNDDWADGLFLDNSEFNLISGNNISQNGIDGIDLSDSNNNTITGNRISHNDDYGISVVRSYSNLIYDNYFENEVNAYFSGNKSRYNTWNVSKRSGTNIVGDPFVGGNYWATPAGTGFSQTHPDFDRDGFSDETNTLFFSDHTDQLPLSNAHNDTEPPESNITDLSAWYEGFTLVGNNGFFYPGEGVWYVAGNTSVRGFARDESAVMNVFFSPDNGTTWISANLSSEPTYDWFNRWRPSTEGTYRLLSKAQDVAGNNESTGTATVIVDQTPPNATLDVTRTNNVSIHNSSTINFSASDENLQKFTLFFQQPKTADGHQSFVVQHYFNATNNTGDASTSTLSTTTDAGVATSSDTEGSEGSTFTYVPIKYNVTDGTNEALPNEVIQRGGLVWTPAEVQSADSGGFYYLGFDFGGALRRVVTGVEWDRSVTPLPETGLTQSEELARIQSGDTIALPHSGTTLTAESRGSNLKLLKDAPLPDGDLTVYWDGIDKAGNKFSASESGTIENPKAFPEADISVTKTGPENASSGQNITHSINVTNHGPDEAADVPISELVHVPEGIAHTVAVTPSSYAVDQKGTSSKIASIPHLPPGESVTINVTFRVEFFNDSRSTTTLENTADASQLTRLRTPYTDPNPENDEDSASTTVVQSAEADIEVGKLGPSSELAGENVTYSVFVENHGPEGATGISITDDWNLSNGSASLVAVEEISETKKGIEWTEFDSQVGIIVTSLGPNESTRIDVTLKVPNGTGNATLTNIARRESTDGYIDPNPENDESGKKETPINERRIADIGVTKSGPERVGEGNVTYTVNVTNHGPDRATNVSIGDVLELPANVSQDFVAGTPASYSYSDDSYLFPDDPDGLVGVTIPSLAPGESVTLTLTFNVTITNSSLSNVTINNTAEAAVPETGPLKPEITWKDPNPENNDDSVSTTVRETPEADIEVRKSGPPTVMEGENVTYYIDVINHGPEGATNVGITEDWNLPTGSASVVDVTELSVPPKGIEWTEFDSKLGLIVTSLGAGERAEIAVTLQVPNGSAGGNLTNVARHESSTGYNDPNPDNDESKTEETPITERRTADISVTKSGPSRASEGDVTYTLNVTNHGPDDAVNVSINDEVTAIALNASDLGEIPFPSIENVTPASYVDRYVKPVGLVPQEVIMTIPSLAPGESVTIDVTANLILSESNATKAELNNTAFYYSEINRYQNDPNPENDRDSASTTVLEAPEADIEVTKSGPPSVMEGENVTYLLRVRNHGPEGATGVSITDEWSLPEGSASVVDVAEISETKKGIEWTEFDGKVGIIITSLAPDETAEILVTLQVPNGTAGANLTNIARREPTADYSDPNPENDDSEEVVTTVNERRVADISVTKSGPARASEGNVTYTVNVTNHGPDNATGVPITDVVDVPAGVSEHIVAVTPSSYSYGLKAPWIAEITIPSLSAGESVTLNVTVNVNITNDSRSIVRINNTARYSPSRFETTLKDPNPENDEGSASTKVLDPAEADIEVRKSGPASVMEGENVTYVLNVTNHGPEGATNVGVTEDWALANGSASVVAVEEVSEVKKGIEWTKSDSKIGLLITSLGPGETARIEVTLQVPNGTAGGNLTNVARHESSPGYADPNPENDESGETVTRVIERKVADVSVNKSGPERVEEGTNATYTVNVTNHGPDVATDVDIRDGLRFLYGGFHISWRFSVSEGSVNDTGSFRWRWSIPRLAPGETATMTVTFRPLYSTAWNGSFRNDVSILPESAYIDPGETNNDDSVPTNVTIPAFSDQPDGWSSDIATHSGGDIYDWQLANMIEMWIAEPGFANLVFFQTQCYSGGILDDLANELAGTGDVALLGSARHDQVAWADGKQSHWAEEVADELARTGSSAPEMGELAKRARRQDESGPYGSDASGWTEVDGKVVNEHPQTKFLGNGSEVKIGKYANGSNVSSKHAVLFIGDAEERHWNNLDRVYKALTDGHGFAPENVHVLADAGPGSPKAPGYVDDPGTKQALFETLRQLSGEMNDGEQLVFWTDNHGTRDRFEHGLLRSIASPDRVTIPPEAPASPETDRSVESSASLTWDLDQGFIDDVRSEPDNVPFVSVIVDPSNASEGFNESITNYTVYLNSEPLAAATVEPIYSFDSNPDLDGYEVIYPVRNESILQLDNVVEGNWTGSPEDFEPFDVRGLHISTGAIDERVPNDTGTPTADIEVTKAGPANATSGENVTYTINVTNHGPDTATDLVIKEAFVTSGDSDAKIEAEYVGRTVANGTVTAIETNQSGGRATGRVFIDIPEVAPGETVTIAITLRIRITNGTRANATVLNSAMVAENDENGTRIEYSWIDPDPENSDGDGNGSSATKVTKFTPRPTSTPTDVPPDTVTTEGFGLITGIAALVTLLLFTRRWDRDGPS